MAGAVAAWAVAAGPGRASAQTAPRVAPPDAYGLAYGGVPVDGACEAPGAVGPGTVSFACNSGGATFAGAATVIAGRIGGVASVTGVNGLSPRPAYDPNVDYYRSGHPVWLSGSRTAWGDRLTLTGGPAPATVAFTMSWDGTLQASMTRGNLQTPGWASRAAAQWTFSADDVNDTYGYHRVYYGNSAVVGASATPSPTTATVNDVRTFAVPVGAIRSFDIVYSLDLASVVSIYDDPQTAAFSASAVADFGSTGKLTGLVFRDAAGGDITSLVSYTFANGTVIAPAATVPEPSTYALLAAGLAGVGAVARRRGRA